MTTIIDLICGFSTCTFKMLKYEINLLSNIEHIDEHGYKIIHYICQFSTPVIIKYIIDLDVDLEYATYKNNKPIHFICLFSTFEIIKHMISKGVDLEHVTNDGDKPIHLLFENKLIDKYERITLIDFMVDHGLDLDNLKES
jgi:ankyrin repeat protein